jgi:hypothetical protein
MVFSRLINKAEEALNEGATPAKKGGRRTLEEHFSSSDVPAAAKETCRNWFYKAACIRDLLPRLYVEMSLFKCYRFLTDTEYPSLLAKQGSIIRGLGDPLVAIYARTQLVVIAAEVAPLATAHASSLLQDAIFSLGMLKQPHMKAEFEKAASSDSKEKVTEKVYLFLLSPGIEWILKNVGRSASREVFQTVLQLYREHSNDSMILKHIIDSFDASHYSHATLGMVNLIKTSNASCFSIVDLFTALGDSFCKI